MLEIYESTEETESLLRFFSDSIRACIGGEQDRLLVFALRSVSSRGGELARDWLVETVDTEAEEVDRIRFRSGSGPALP